jgi:hypothetical protein
MRAVVYHGPGQKAFSWAAGTGARKVVLSR